MTNQKGNSIIKLPGLVDVHVHLREPGGNQKEDFITGTKAAIAGGYTQILDMPNNNPPTVTEKDLKDKKNLAKDRIWCDLGFNFGGTRESISYFKALARKAFGLKVYMNQTTGPLLIEKDADTEIIFKSWISPLPIMVHAEGETIKTAIKLAKKYRKNLHICHVTSNQLKIIQKAKEEGIKISCEVCPHHLFLSKDDLKSLGGFGVMKPPLLSSNEQQKLWENLDKIDMISTDHAPHTFSEKMNKPAPFGVPGLETTLPLMLTAVANGRISIKRLIEMTSSNPRKVFKLPVQKNTYVLIDFSQKYLISQENLYTKCGWTPFKGMQGRGRIKKVVLRGKIVFENGNFLGIPRGQTITPKI